MHFSFEIVDTILCNKCSTPTVKAAAEFCVNVSQTLRLRRDRLQDWLVNKSGGLSQSREQLRRAIVRGDGTMCSPASVSILLTTWSATGRDREPLLAVLAQQQQKLKGPSLNSALQTPILNQRLCTHRMNHTESVALNESC